MNTPRSPPLLTEKGRRRRTIGEVAGGTTAECAAVWCCFPCAALNVLLLALYKVPVGICRRAWAHKKKKKKKRGGAAASLIRRRSVGGGVLLQRGPTIEELERRLDALNNTSNADAAGEEEEEDMWGRFSTSGFWRSPSRRNDDDNDH